MSFSEIYPLFLIQYLTLQQEITIGLAEAAKARGRLVERIKKTVLMPIPLCYLLLIGKLKQEIVLIYTHAIMDGESPMRAHSKADNYSQLMSIERENQPYSWMSFWNWLYNTK